MNQLACAEVQLALVYLHRNSTGDLEIADTLATHGAAQLEEVLGKSPRDVHARGRIQRVGEIHPLAAARRGRVSEAERLSGSALQSARTITAESQSTQNRLDRGTQWMHRAALLLLCGKVSDARAAAHEAETWFAGRQSEIGRSLTVACRIGNTHFGIARSMETEARRKFDRALWTEAASHYGAAAQVWSRWQNGHPYLQPRGGGSRGSRSGTLTNSDSP